MASNYLIPWKEVPKLGDSSHWANWFQFIRIQAHAARVWQYLDPKISDKDIIKFCLEDRKIDFKALAKKNGRAVIDERKYWVDEDYEEYERGLNSLGEILKQMYATVDPSLQHVFNFEERKDDVLLLEGLHLARRVLVRLAENFIRP